MADQADKATESAEKAYAAAAAETLVPKSASAAELPPAPKAPAPAPEAKKVVEAKPAAKPAPVKTVAAKKSAPKAPKNAPAPAKAAAKPAAKKIPAKAAKPAPKKTPSKKTTQTKEPTMAKTPDFTQTVTEAVADFQTKAKTAYDKSAALAGEATEFAKGNVEAMVESGKIFTEGFQAIGKTYADEAKSAFETATADLKEIAAIKSPTELFQLQGKLARRNFDSLVAFSSKSSEAFVKLASEGFAPISGRVSLAAGKLSKAA
jgi:phasin family protein